MEARSKQGRVLREMGSQDGGTTSLAFPVGDTRDNHPKEGGKEEGCQSLLLYWKMCCKEEKLLKVSAVRTPAIV